jgi:esterase/lipase
MCIAGQGDPTPFEEWHGEAGCLLLHSFPGSPAELREVGAYLGQRGISVVVPALPGGAPGGLAARGVRRLQERCD